MEYSYPTFEEFANTHMGKEPIIVHNSEDFEYWDKESSSYKIDEDAEIVFTHLSTFNAIVYLKSKWRNSRVVCWRIYPDGIHCAVLASEDEKDE